MEDLLGQTLKGLYRTDAFIGRGGMKDGFWRSDSSTAGSTPYALPMCMLLAYVRSPTNFLREPPLAPGSQWAGIEQYSDQERPAYSSVATVISTKTRSPPRLVPSPIVAVFRRSTIPSMTTEQEPVTYGSLLTSDWSISCTNTVMEWGLVPRRRALNNWT